MSFDDSGFSAIQNEQIFREKESKIFSLQLEMTELKNSLNDLKLTSKNQIQKLEMTVKQKEELIATLGDLIQNSHNSQLMTKYEQRVQQLETENSKLRKVSHALSVKAKQKTNSNREIALEFGSKSPNRNSVELPNLSPISTGNEIKSLQQTINKNADLKSMNSNHKEQISNESLSKLKSNQNENTKAYIETIQKFEKGMKEKTEKTHFLELSNKELSKKVNELEQTIQKQTNIIHESEDSIFKFLAKIDELKNTVDDLNKEISSKQSVHESFIQTTRKTTISKSENENVISALKFDLDLLKAELRTVNNKYNELQKNHEDLEKIANEEQMLLQTQLLKKEAEVLKQNEKIESLLEKNHEYLERLQKQTISRDIVNEHIQERHETELKELHFKVVELNKALAEANSEKLINEKIAHIKKSPERELNNDSFRILAHVGLNPNGSNEDKPHSDHQIFSLRETLQNSHCEKKSENSQKKFVLQKNESFEIQKDKDLLSNVSPDKVRVNSKSTNIQRNPSPVIFEGKKSKILKFSNPKPEAMSNLPIDVSHVDITRKSGMIARDSDPNIDNLSDLVRDIDDPILHYIAELDEKNKEIQTLRTNLRLIEKQTGIDELKEKSTTLQLELKHMKENLQQIQNTHQEELSFQKQLNEEITEMLTQTKIKFSNIASEKDVLIINFNRKIKKLKFQIEIYENQIRSFNEGVFKSQNSASKIPGTI